MKQSIKTFIIAISLMATPYLLKAHDGGHGPKITDVGLFGGILSAVVKEEDKSKGHHANLVYKAELTQSQDGTVRVYLYDKKMKPLKLSQFSKKASAVLISFVEGKEDLEKFELELKGRNFVGKSPAKKSKPYNIDITFEENGSKYFVAFDKLD